MIGDGVEGLLGRKAIKIARIHQPPVIEEGTVGNIRRRTVQRIYDFFNGQRILGSEFPVPLIVTGHRHHGARAIGHEDEVRHPDGHRLAGQRCEERINGVGDRRLVPQDRFDVGFAQPQPFVPGHAKTRSEVETPFGLHSRQGPFVVPGIPDTVDHKVDGSAVQRGREPRRVVVATAQGRQLAELTIRAAPGRPFPMTRSAWRLRPARKSSVHRPGRTGRPGRGGRASPRTAPARNPWPGC